MGYQNFFATRLATEIGASDTVITLEHVPNETEGKLVLEARNPTQREIITYTGISGNQITGVTRGYGGTTAKPHLRNALVEMNLTAEDLQEIYDLFGSGSVLINTAKLARFVSGAGVPDSVGVLGDEKYYTTVGANTWTKPEGLRFIIVEVQAGGGGGGAGGSTSSGQSSYGGGGGGGAYARKKILAADLAATETITVGAGGLGGRSGQGEGDNGENTSFGSHSWAAGGRAGGFRGGAAPNGQNASGGHGGSDGDGDIVIYGSGGMGGLQDSTHRGMVGGGGGSYLGGGTAQRNQGATGGSTSGTNGFQYGGGGGAGGNGTSSTISTGGNGAQGVVIVHEYF